MRQLKEAACCGIGSIVRHSGQLAMDAVSQGAATLLVLCLQLNELNIKQVATLALGDIARHSPKHAKAVCDAGGAASLMTLVDNLDVKLKVTFTLIGFDLQTLTDIPFLRDNRCARWATLRPIARRWLSWWPSQMSSQKC